MAKEAGVKIVDFRFIDLFGTWQHSSNSINDVDEGFFSDGVGFDGSSIRGFQAINESDMLLMPDPTTAVVDPFLSVPTLSILCDVYDPVTRARYTRDSPVASPSAREAFLQVDRLWRRRLLRTRNPSSSSTTTTSATTPITTAPSTRSTRAKGSGTPAPTKGRT